MTTTPTNKPIPSEDPRDLKFNAGKIDEVVTSESHYYTDRFGVRRWTIAGFQYTAEEAIRNYGYITMDSFEDGATLTLPNHVLRYEATGEYYRWDGDFPKTVSSGSTPETAGGVGLGKWVSVGDASLRGQITDPNSIQKYPELQISRWREAGDPRGWGGVGDGVADDTAAVSSALQTGKLNLADKNKIWRLTQTISKTGKVHITGEGKVVCDFKGTAADPAFAFKIIDGSGSVVDGEIHMEPKLVPYTIRRNRTTWAMVGTWEQRFDGYIPTPQDLDIWSSVPQEVRDFNTGIGTGILFTVSSASGGDNVSISGLRGNQITVVLQGYSNSRVFNCTMGVGQITLGGIYFHNGVTRAYNQAILGYRLPRGEGNSVYDCDIKYSSLSGICFSGNDYFFVTNCSSTCHAESAFKTMQYDGVEGVTGDKAVISTRGTFMGNFAGFCYYDGYDGSALNLVPYEYIFGGHRFSSNIAESNRLSGFNVGSSSESIVSNNTVNLCGDVGMTVVGSNQLVFGNKIIESALSPVNPQAYQLVVQGDGCISFGNHMIKNSPPNTYDYIHTGLLGANPTTGLEGLDFGNYCTGGVSRMSISPTIPSAMSGIKGRVTTDSLIVSKPKSVTGNYTVAETDYALSFFTTSGSVVTLPSAAACPGRVLEMRNTSAYGVVSASNDVGQITGGAPTNAILPATVGSWCKLQSNGSEWIIMAKG